MQLQFLRGVLLDIFLHRAAVEIGAAGRLKREGRIIEDGRWDLCTLFDVNHFPRQMTPQQLREGMYWLTENLYNAECTAFRRGTFFRNLRSQEFAELRKAA